MRPPMKFLVSAYNGNADVDSRRVTDYLRGLLGLGNELVYTDDVLN
jgi:hypothetical protein